MSRAGIVLTQAHLHYAATAFKERSLKSMLGAWLAPGRRPPEVADIHALRGIDLRIDPGERVGLVGRNGAGKSTLLKAIAGLYPLSSGDCATTGEVRSLFELGLGFEPDATGRENILYRGLLLGLSPATMRTLEAEIVAFADLGPQIDYPIRTYSAGMQVRLAFAISTAVGADILLLDEVIGAGDAAFMAKARQRIQELVDDASIVVLASHDFAAIEQLCTRCLVLADGAIAFDGPVAEARSFYLDVPAAGMR